MRGLLVDSNIILDIFLDDPVWADWSEAALSEYAIHTPLYINPIIYSEISIGFKKLKNWKRLFQKVDFRCWKFQRNPFFLPAKLFLNTESPKVERTPLYLTFLLVHMPLYQGLN